MSLPLAISGIGDLAAVGPYRSSAGNFYLFAKDASTATTLQCFKATDPESGWSSVATKTGFDTAIKDIAGPDPLSLVNCGDLIRLAIIDGTAASANAKFQTFDMGSETFATQETIASNFAVHQTYNTSDYDQFQIAIAVRSGGEELVVFNGAVETVNTKEYSRVYWSRRSDVNTWTGPTLLCPSGEEKQAYTPRIVLGASDRVHFIYGYLVTLQTQSLSSSNVLDTTQAYGNAAYGAFSVISYVNPSGETWVVGAQASNSGIGRLEHYQFKSEANPSPITYSGITDTGTCLSACAAIYDAPVHTISYLYRYDPDGTIYAITSSDNGSSWPSNSQTIAETVDLSDQALSVNVVPYLSNPNNVVAPVVYKNAGASYYHRRSLRSLLYGTSEWLGEGIAIFNDSGFSPPIGDPFRLRFSIANEGSVVVDAAAWQLYVSKNGGAYHAVTTTSDDVRSTDAGASADETQILIPRLSLPA